MADIEYVAEGDVVIVTSGNHPSNRQSQRYVVTKVARVWITVRPEGDEDRNHWADRRFRLDDHTDGSRIGAPNRFHTLAEWEKIQREGRAVTFLREQGIDIRNGSPWHRRYAELADVIATHLAAPLDDAPLDDAPDGA